jgi:hypothetical protein
MQWLLVGSLVESHLPVHYPFQFKALAGAVVGISAFWAADFFTITLPRAHRQDSVQSECELEGKELTENAKTLWYYFLFFVAARLLFSVPRVTACVSDSERSLSRRCCRRYCLHMLIHGPLYMFCVASATFCMQIVAAKCASYNEALYQDLNLYATYSCMVSIMSFILAVWQDRLVAEAYREQAREKRRAPEGTINSIPTVRYDPSFFGEGEDKLYHSECPICLMEWDTEDRIKVTACNHAFHEECLSRWFLTNRTCALCRRDLTRRPLDRETAVARTPRTRTATASAAGGDQASTGAGSLEPVQAIDDPEMGVNPQTIGMRMESV